MKTMARLTILAVIGVLVAGIAVAQFAKPEDAIGYRKAVMSVIVQHFKQMGAVVQGKAPYDRETFASNAETVAMLARLPWDAFMEPGTEKGDTDMNSAVFEKKDEFLKLSLSFQNATAQLASAAETADVDGLKAPFNAVAQECKACHSGFRK